MLLNKKIILIFCSALLVAACTTTTKQNSTPIPMPAEVETTSNISIENPKQDLALVDKNVTKPDTSKALTEIIEPTFWETMVADFSFPEIKHADIDKELNKLLASPVQVKQNIENSLTLLSYVYEQVKERNLPAELALIPFIESNYQIAARSSSNAKGLWQIMPKTASSLGLTHSWWQDDSYNVILSTDSALNYLTKHYARFDDWLLAIAAYNAGSFRVAKAVKKSPKQASTSHFFFDLQLPLETENYIPRLLAYKNLIQHHKMHSHIFETNPVIKDVSELKITQQTSLEVIARTANIDNQWLKKYNPGYLQWATPPQSTAALLIPEDLISTASTQLTLLSEQERLPWFLYTIKSGDTLSQIAHSHRTSTQQLKKLNGLINSKIIAGKKLKIPATQNLESKSQAL